MARTSLEKHPGTDRLPYRLCPGGEGGRTWLEMPGLGLGHDGAESWAEVDRGPVALPAPGMTRVVTVGLSHQVDVTEITKFSPNRKM